MEEDVLAKYYPKWYQDCLDSIEWCKSHNQPLKAEEYRIKAEKYKQLMENSKCSNQSLK